MEEAVFKVAFAGPHVSLQDMGRPGNLRFGVPASGPMDRAAFQTANLALGNPVGQPGIEVSLGGLSLVCEKGPVTVAIAGGGFIVETGDHRAGSWTVLTLLSGQTLTLRPGPWGSWTYLALKGVIDGADWLGSRATHTTSGLGGRIIRSGDRLSISDARALTGLERSLTCPVWARPRHVLRCVLGPQDRFFSRKTIEDFSGATFQVSHAYDRMGVRLTGAELPPANALGIPSEPIVRGSVQVSGDGRPTVLMADHQTTGGYPKIATVLNCDLDGFAQCRPQQPVRFQPVRAAEAVSIARSAHAARQAYFSALAAATESIRTACSDGPSHQRTVPQETSYPAGQSSHDPGHS